MSKHLLVAATVLVAACATTKSADKPASGGNAEVKASCVKVFQKQRECSDAFLPALVDLRIKLDVPAGIAAKGAGDGRDKLIAEATEEWKKDSTDDAINATCEKMSGNPGGEKMKQATEPCLAQTECKAFVDCVIPTMEEHIKAGPPAK